MDYAEFTKSEREKSAEMLFVWRNQLGWQMPRRGLKTHSGRKLSLALIGLVSTVLVIAFSLRP